MELTEPDRAILRLMQQDASLTITELATCIGTSPSAAQRRLQRLRDEKIILRDVSIVDPKRLGTKITLLVELELEKDRPDLHAPLHAWIARTPQVQQAWCLTGHSDYTLVIVTDTIDEFDALSDAMMSENRNVRKFTTSVVLKQLKRTLAVPL